MPQKVAPPVEGRADANTTAEPGPTRSDPVTADALHQTMEETQSGPSPQAQRSSPSAPIDDVPAVLRLWERYQVLEIIGAGGMGAVYKGRDPRLHRMVALKLIHPRLGHGPGSSGEVVIRRFQREARLQAALDHPHICKVYEIGELPSSDDSPGHPYIAMQLIDGLPLHKAAQDLTLLEKVQVLKQVAEALHAAHRQGLIHRDIKPSNIMVERLPEGGLHPYVMDFGLARETTAKDHSRSGAIEGTPRFMAPEQARGHTRQLDRRTDVYALGVTMYELFVGASPYSASSDVDMLLAVLLQEPKAPRLVDRTLPEDLEAVILKCLEKEQAARYDSAKALADDLGRYLNGTPVQARRIGPLGRLYRRAQRNKLLSAIIGAATFLMLLQGALYIRAQKRAARSLTQAEGLGQDLKEIELFLRFVSSMPLHDIGREQALIRARMQSIEKQFTGDRGQAAALAYYALGRGDLALGEPAPARTHLEAALKLGHRTPEVHYALGRALGELYQRALDDIRFAGTPSWQEQQRQRLGTTLLEPALAHFAQARGRLLESSRYAAGLMAYHNGQLEEALTAADATLAESPWIYEADVLAADTLRQLGWLAYRKGEYEKSADYYERAARRYRAAREIGRTDPQIHVREAQLYIQRIQLAAEMGDDPSSAGEQALAASERAIAASRDSAIGYQAKAHALMRLLHQRQENGLDLGTLPEQVIEYAQRVERMEPQNPMPYYFLGVATIIRFTHAVEHGQSGLQSFEDGIRYYQKLLELKPDYSRAYNDMGCAYGLRAEWLAKHGQDGSAAFAQSMQYLRRAIDDDEEDVYPKYNLVDISRRMMNFQYANGKLDEKLLSDALAIESYVAKHKRADFIIYSYLGQAMLPRLKVDVAQNRELAKDAAAALAYLDHALQLNAKFHETQRGRAEVFAMLALDAQLGGRDASEAIRNGLAAANAAIAANSIDGPSHAIKARLHLFAAQKSALASAERRQNISDGESAAQKALQLDAALAEAHIVQAKLAALRGAIDEGLRAIEPALQQNPRDAEALATQATLLHMNPSSREQAAQVLTTALSINPYLRREYSQLLPKAK